MSTTRKLKENTFHHFADVYQEATCKNEEGLPTKVVKKRYEISECVGYEKNTAAQSARLKAAVDACKERCSLEQQDEIKLRLYPGNLKALELFFKENPWIVEEPLIHLYILTGDMEDDPAWTKEQQEKYKAFANIDWRKTDKWKQAGDKFRKLQSEALQQKISETLEIDCKEFINRHPTFPKDKVEIHIINEAIDILRLMEENTADSAQGKLHALMHPGNLTHTMHVIFANHKLFGVKKDSLVHIKYVTYDPEKAAKKVHTDDILRPRDTNLISSHSSAPSSPPSSPGPVFLSPPQTPSSSLSEEEQTELEKLENQKAYLFRFMKLPGTTQEYLANYLYHVVHGYATRKLVDISLIAKLIFDIEKDGHFSPEFDLATKMTDRLCQAQIDALILYNITEAYSDIKIAAHKAAEKTKQNARSSDVSDPKPHANESILSTVSSLSKSCRTEAASLSSQGSALFYHQPKAQKLTSSVSNESGSHIVSVAARS